MTRPANKRAIVAARAGAVLVAVGLAAACPAAAGSGSSAEVVVGDVEGDGWRAGDVTLSLATADDGTLAATVRIGTLTLPPRGAIRGLEAVCPRTFVGPATVRCDALTLRGAGRREGWPALTGPFEYRRDTGAVRWTARIDSAGEAGGALTLTARLRGDRPAGALRLDDVLLDPWFRLWQDLRAQETGQPAQQGEDAALGGRLDLELSLAAPAGGPARISGSGRLRGLAGHNPDGTLAAEGIDLELGFEAHTEPGAAVFEARAAAAAGEAYRQPVYAHLGDHPLTVSVAGRLEGATLRLEPVAISQEGVTSGTGRVLLRAGEDGGWAVAEATLALDDLRLPGAYDVLMQPFLAKTDLGDLETLGSARGLLRFEQDRVVALTLAFDGVQLDDRAGRLAVYGLDGALSWGEAAGEAPARLDWDGGFLYGFSYGAAALEFRRLGGGLALAAPVSIPVLDGALEIDVLELGDPGAERASAALDARLTPVDMRAVALALGWPPLSGTLSGSLPRLSYRDGELTLGGDFTAEVFDGSVRIRDFSVREPFAAGARLRAEIEIERLDLRQVTEAFSFGLITGRLDGYVKGLRMIDWEPVAFDARLYTSKRDAGRRRISQRAVDNIASLGGGGGAAALSSGFLRLFDEFAYDRIALGCRRELDVCHMSGIEPYRDGYLILRGRGLPRITVVGYATEVSFSTLASQLSAITTSGGPVIE